MTAYQRPRWIAAVAIRVKAGMVAIRMKMKTKANIPRVFCIFFVIFHIDKEITTWNRYRLSW
jgi:hypothetical protein